MTPDTLKLVIDGGILVVLVLVLFAVWKIVPPFLNKLMERLVNANASHVETLKEQSSSWETHNDASRSALITAQEAFKGLSEKQAQQSEVMIEAMGTLLRFSESAEGRLIRVQKEHEVVLKGVERLLKAKEE